MAKIKSKVRVVEYSTEFKDKVVALTNELDVDTTVIAKVMGLHPVMVYRWRQEHREGTLVSKPSRRFTMTKSKPPPTPADAKELKRLKKEVAKLQKENDFLKKWGRYLRDQKQNGSDL